MKINFDVKTQFYIFTATEFFSSSRKIHMIIKNIKIFIVKEIN